MSAGITFFNFGGGCMVRLLVALDSLRSVYDGNVTVQLAKGDDFNDKARKDIAKYADIQDFDLERLTKRNLKSVIKPMLFRMSPYDSTLMLDGDLLIQKDPSELLGHINEIHQFLVTSFSSWNCDGNRMRKRVLRCEKWLWPSDRHHIFNEELKHPAINIGIMGWHKSGESVMADWEWMTKNLAGQHIADEVACQCIFHRHNYYMAEETWNSSVLYGQQDPKDAAILHYHGNKHTEPKRPSSRRWLHYLAKLIDSGKIEGMDEYLSWNDKAMRDALKKNKNLLKEALSYE